MAGAKNRPLSPHLTIWKWGPHMTVSILHRASGIILATAGVLTLLWFVMAVSSGPEAYATFSKWVFWTSEEGGDVLTTLSHIFFMLLGIVVSWAFFEHLFSGLRHLVLDMGAGYELKTNRKWSLAVMMASIIATVGLWIIIFAKIFGGA